MIKATVRFLRAGAPAKNDDVLHIYDDDDYHETYRLTFHPGAWKTHNEFYLSHPALLDYVSGILKTMTHDADPFEHIQVETAMHPAVLYHVSDVDERDTRELIRSTLDTALRRPIDRIKH